MSESESRSNSRENYSVVWPLYVLRRSYERIHRSVSMKNRRETIFSAISLMDSGFHRVSRHAIFAIYPEPTARKIGVVVASQ
jgi:hypothetical protein